MESWLLGWLIGSIAVLLIQYFVAREFQRISENCRNERTS